MIPTKGQIINNSHHGGRAATSQHPARGARMLAVPEGLIDVLVGQLQGLVGKILRDVE